MLWKILLQILKILLLLNGNLRPKPSAEGFGFWPNASASAEGKNSAFGRPLPLGSQAQDMHNTAELRNFAFFLFQTLNFWKILPLSKLSIRLDFQAP